LIREQLGESGRLLRRRPEPELESLDPLIVRERTFIGETCRSWIQAPGKRHHSPAINRGSEAVASVDTENRTEPNQDKAACDFSSHADTAPNRRNVTRGAKGHGRRTRLEKNLAKLM
jgi:hypothetical protein